MVVFKYGNSEGIVGIFSYTASNERQYLKVIFPLGRKIGGEGNV